MWASFRSHTSLFYPADLSENKGHSRFAVRSEFTIDIVAINTFLANKGCDCRQIYCDAFVIRRILSLIAYHQEEIRSSEYMMSRHRKS